LPASVERQAGEALAADFSDVRVHVGEQAPRLDATAFAAGRQLYFAPGAYDPGTGRGRWLIAHELAHVVQQENRRATVSPGNDAVVHDVALEAEADRLATSIEPGAPVERASAAETAVAAEALSVRADTSAVSTAIQPMPAKKKKKKTAPEGSKAKKLKVVEAESDEDSEAEAAAAAAAKKVKKAKANKAKKLKDKAKKKLKAEAAAASEAPAKKPKKEETKEGKEEEKKTEKPGFVKVTDRYSGEESDTSDEDLAPATTEAARDAVYVGKSLARLEIGRKKQAAVFDNPKSIPGVDLVPREEFVEALAALATSLLPLTAEQEAFIAKAEPLMRDDEEKRVARRQRYGRPTRKALRQLGRFFKRTSSEGNVIIRTALGGLAANTTFVGKAKLGGGANYEDEQGRIRGAIASVVEAAHAMHKFTAGDFASPAVWNAVNFVIEQGISNDSKQPVYGALLAEAAKLGDADKPVAADLKGVTARAAFHHVAWKKAAAGAFEPYALVLPNLSLLHDSRQVGKKKRAKLKASGIEPPPGGGHEEAGHRLLAILGKNHFVHPNLEALYYVLKGAIPQFGKK
jgi:hypothetical protein